VKLRKIMEKLNNGSQEDWWLDDRRIELDSRERSASATLGTVQRHTYVFLEGANG
jgi:hypothetical protein